MRESTFPFRIVTNLVRIKLIWYVFYTTDLCNTTSISAVNDNTDENNQCMFFCKVWKPYVRYFIYKSSINRLKLHRCFISITITLRSRSFQLDFSLTFCCQVFHYWSVLYTTYVQISSMHHLFIKSLFQLTRFDLPVRQKIVFKFLTKWRKHTLYIFIWCNQKMLCLFLIFKLYQTVYYSLKHLCFNS